MLCNENEETTATSHSDKFHKHSSEWKKPDVKRHILYDSTYIKFQQGKLTSGVRNHNREEESLGGSTSGVFWEKSNFLLLDFGGGYVGGFTLWILFSCTAMIYVLFMGIFQ